MHKVRIESLPYSDDAWCTAGEGGILLSLADVSVISFVQKLEKLGVG